jgi:glycosyltransferase involved in cell wall biosynthesis
VKILMIAPQPFFRPRGTPFSVLQRLRGLTALGHTIDLVTYPFGEDVGIPGVRIHRSGHVPTVSDVPVGPSLAKILLDVPLFARARQLAAAERYDLVHTHEEGAIMGAWLSRRYGIPHLYDMHSSLPEQFANFGKYNWRPVVSLFRRLEQYTLDRSDLLITICPELGEHVARTGFSRPHAMIENTLELTASPPEWQEVERLRDELGLRGKKLVVYTGTVEAYQGLDLLLSAAAPVAEAVPDVHFLVVGGSAEQAGELRAAADSLGLARRFSFVPSVEPERVPVIQRLASCLVTCRIRGINTPLKLYQYLRAGRPIVATAIRSHTQVLNERCAELVEATAEGVAAGLVRVLSDPVRSDELASGAAAVAEEHYSSAAYMAKLSGLMEQAEQLVARAPAPSTLSAINTP